MLAEQHQTLAGKASSVTSAAVHHQGLCDPYPKRVYESPGFVFVITVEKSEQKLARFSWKQPVLWV